MGNRPANYNYVFEAASTNLEMETKPDDEMVCIGNSKKRVEWKTSGLAWMKDDKSFLDSIVLEWNLSWWLVEAAGESIMLIKFSSCLA